jgi:hypothetical protein
LAIDGKRLVHLVGDFASNVFDEAYEFVGQFNRESDFLILGVSSPIPFYKQQLTYFINASNVLYAFVRTRIRLSDCGFESKAFNNSLVANSNSSNLLHISSSNSLTASLSELAAGMITS